VKGGKKGLKTQDAVEGVMPKLDSDLYCTYQRMYKSFYLTGGIFISSADLGDLESLQLCKVL
jgi:hypothetical protein